MTDGWHDSLQGDLLYKGRFVPAAECEIISVNQISPATVVLTALYLLTLCRYLEFNRRLNDLIKL